MVYEVSNLKFDGPSSFRVSLPRHDVTTYVDMLSYGFRLFWGLDVGMN